MIINILAFFKKKKGYYYFAVIEDLVLRFGWTLSVSLTESGYIHSDLMVTILAPLEVFRCVFLSFRQILTIVLPFLNCSHI